MKEQCFLNDHDKGEAKWEKFLSKRGNKES